MEKNKIMYFINAFLLHIPDKMLLNSLLLLYSSYNFINHARKYCPAQLLLLDDISVVLDNTFFQINWI